MFIPGIVASKQVSAVVEYVASGSALGTTVTIPAHTSGDWIIVFAIDFNGGSMTTPSGYTRFVDLDSPTTGTSSRDSHTSIYKKEGTGTTEDVIVAGANYVGYIVCSGTGGAVQAATVANYGYDINVPVPAITPSVAGGMYLSSAHHSRTYTTLLTPPTDTARIKVYNTGDCFEWRYGTVPTTTSTIAGWANFWIDSSVRYGWTTAAIVVLPG